MVESNFMKVYDELSMLNEKWYASKEYWSSEKTALATASYLIFSIYINPQWR